MYKIYKDRHKTYIEHTPLLLYGGMAARGLTAAPRAATHLVLLSSCFVEPVQYGVIRRPVLPSEGAGELESSSAGAASSSGHAPLSFSLPFSYNIIYIY